MNTKDSKRGPEPERLKLDDEWEEAVDQAMKKPRPESGWPKRDSDSESKPDPRETKPADE